MDNSPIRNYAAVAAHRVWPERHPGGARRRVRVRGRCVGPQPVRPARRWVLVSTWTYATCRAIHPGHPWPGRAPGQSAPPPAAPGPRRRRTETTTCRKLPQTIPNVCQAPRPGYIGARLW